MGPASCSARSAPTSCNCQLGCQPTWRPSRLLSSPPSTSHCHAAIRRLNEPLFFNKQICQPAASSAATNTACPTAAFLIAQQKPLMVSAGITKVAYLRLSLQLQQPQLLASELSSVLLAIPPAWRTIVSSAPASTWFQVPSASGRSFKMLRQASSTSLTPICNFNKTHQSLSLIPALSKSCLEIPLGLGGIWRDLEGPKAPVSQQGSPLYLQGQL